MAQLEAEEKPRCTSVYLPISLRNKLRSEAKRQNRSVSNLLVLIIAKFLHQQELDRNGTKQ